MRTVLFMIAAIAVYVFMKDILSANPTRSSGENMLLMLFVMVPLMAIGMGIKHLDRWKKYREDTIHTKKILQQKGVIPAPEDQPTENQQGAPSPLEDAPHILAPSEPDDPPERISVFLRPFLADLIEVKNPALDGWAAWLVPLYRFILPDTVSLDDGLRYALQDPEHFVAIGNNTDQIGTAKIESSDSDWQRQFERLVPVAEIVLIVPGVRPGTEWEISRLRTLDMLPRCLFLLLPLPLLIKCDPPDTFDLEAIRAMFTRQGIDLPQVTPSNARIKIGDAVAFDISGKLIFHQHAAASPGIFCTILNISRLRTSIEQVIRNCRIEVPIDLARRY